MVRHSSLVGVEWRSNSEVARVYLETSFVSYLTAAPPRKPGPYRGRSTTNYNYVAVPAASREFVVYQIVIDEIQGDIMMITDPIVERLHRQREEYPERFQYDFDAFDRDIGSRETSPLTWKHVDLEDHPS